MTINSAEYQDFT